MLVFCLVYTAYFGLPRTPNLYKSPGFYTVGRAENQSSGGLTKCEVLRQVAGKKPLAAHVIAVKLDRPFFDAADALYQKTGWGWDRAGVALHLVDIGGQSLNTASAMGWMILTMMAGFAELERNLIAERTADALAHKKAHHTPYGPPPIGF